MAGTAILPEDQKIFSMKELKEKGFSQYKVSKLVDEGKLIKLNKSYYENAEYRGEESDFYYMEAYAPKGVICLLSASSFLLISSRAVLRPLPIPSVRIAGRETRSGCSS